MSTADATVAPTSAATAGDGGDAAPAAPDDPAPARPSAQRLRDAAAAVALAQRSGHTLLVAEALAGVGRIHAERGEHAAAVGTLEAALRWARAGASTDAVVDLLCLLCEAHAARAEALAARSGIPAEGGDATGARAARASARDHAFEAATLAGRVADTGWEVKVLLRISDVHDRCGHRADAVQLQTRAMQLMGAKGDGDAAARFDCALLPGLGRLADG
jgi:hypothetical protein